MVDYEYKDLFWEQHKDKQLRIVSEDGSVTLNNTDIHFEQFGLDESICSEESIVFGSCESSMVKFRISNVFIPLTGKWLIVSETIGGHEETPIQIGRYKVVSDIPTADKSHRDVTAYDEMTEILGKEMAEWYNSILPEKESKVSMKEFRKSFLQHFGIEEVVPDGGLVNDGMIVERTIEPEQISGKDIITSICEINGCFGHIGRDGKFHYIYLEQNIQGLYPRNDLYPSDTLYPRDPKTTRIGDGTYISCQYEDFLVNSINKLQIRKEENDIGAIIGSGDNCYIIENNFLVYGKGESELDRIGNNIYKKITGIIYRPFSCESIGNPCFEIGDPIRISTKRELIETYILKRTLRGIQDPRDEYSADGKQKYSEDNNSVHKQIIELKGKANILTRTVDETKLEMYDIEKGLFNTITITASEIRTELQNTASGLSSRITQNAESITAEVNRATSAEGSLSSSIKINADSITSEVRRATSAEGTLSSSIYQNSQSIALRVRYDDVVSAINMSPEQITIKANKISLEGITTINKRFTVDEQGNAILGDSQGSYAMMNGNNLFVGSSGNNMQISGSGIIQYTDGEIYSVVQSSGKSIVIGALYKPITQIYTSLLNGGIPITSVNISQYIPDHFSSLTVDNLYTSGNSDSVGNRITWLHGQTDALWTRIRSVETRLSALESASAG